jgi:hypothetical protein
MSMQDEQGRTVRNTNAAGDKDWTVATTKIGEQMKTKLQNIQNTGLSDKERNAVLDDLLGLAETLIQMGTDENYPIPPI